MKHFFYSSLMSFITPLYTFAQVDSDETGGYFIGSLIASLVLITATYLFLVWIAVNDSGEAQEWVVPFTIVVAVLSIFLFELSLIPILAVAGGVTLFRHSNRTGVGIAAVLVGMWFLFANILLNTGIV